MAGKSKRRMPAQLFERDLCAARQGARQHNIPPATELTPREKEVKKEIFRDPEAKSAFELLVERGYPETALIVDLVQEAWAPEVLSGRKMSTTRDTFSASEVTDGVARLNRLGDRLKKEALNFRQPEPHILTLAGKYPALAPALFESAGNSPHPVHVLRRCAGELIRSAAYLKRWKAWHLPPKRDTRTKFTKAFLQAILAATGHHYHERVAAMLQITHKMAGRGDRVSRDSLRKLSGKS